MFPQSSKNGPMSPMWQQPCPIHGVEVVPQESPTLGCLNLLSRRCRLLMLSAGCWRSTTLHVPQAFKHRMRVSACASCKAWHNRMHGAVTWSSITDDMACTSSYAAAHAEACNEMMPIRSGDKSDASCKRPSAMAGDSVHHSGKFE